MTIPSAVTLKLTATRDVARQGAQCDAESGQGRREVANESTEQAAGKAAYSSFYWFR
ncbi:MULTISPECIES: hypothetical protein [Pseudomonadaceae]|uniref:hypothetical protein n=1 Tax=Pseudomonadaceae TaxID=135621 RepID=UPI0014044810|nr:MULTISPECIES: hypothetical protein [Pseudomonadaceae]MBA1276822.1 hypothetical protein [Stutzerimonas stutzeri]QXY93270.1 hypothetical protein GYM54_17525 [Pseudomonas sp. MTM4]